MKQHKDNEKAVELLEKMKEVCEEEKTDGVVSKLQAKVSDPFVAQFLCGGLNFFTVKEMSLTMSIEADVPLCSLFPHNLNVPMSLPFAVSSTGVEHRGTNGALEALGVRREVQTDP